MSVFIIAEAGVNHNGDIELAKKLIAVAAEAGCDAVKFQTFSAQELVIKNAEKARYQEVNDGKGSQLEMLKRLQLSDEDHHLLKEACFKNGIEFLSTGFGVLEIKRLVNLGVRRIKIPSGELTNLPLLQEAAKADLPILLSTGMANLAEVQASLQVLLNAGCTGDRITILHCTSLYPAPAETVNLKAMQTMRDAFGVAVGYSDHTLGDEIAIAAVALGASVIEKHFTINRTLPGPDHRASLEPDELRQLVRSIRIVESSLGNGDKQPDLYEQQTRNVARRSIVAARSIRRGEIFTINNITCKRPGTGMSPMLWNNLIGISSSQNYQVDDLINEVLP
jgi:N,N'-diacetyllegionaminate synthase